MTDVPGGDEQPDTVATTAVLQEQEERDASTSGRSETEDASKTPCAFYMRTGTCAYGDRCKFVHPTDRPTVYNNSRGLPLRPDEPQCSFYLRNGWCAFAKTCKFHHPELPVGQPTPAHSQNQPRNSDQRSSSSQQPQSNTRQPKNGTTGQRRHHPATLQRASSGSSPPTKPPYQHHGYAYYMPQYAEPMPSPPGQTLLMHYGFYPGLTANQGQMYPLTPALVHPMMHSQPFSTHPPRMSHLAVPVRHGVLQRPGSSSSARGDGTGRGSSSNDSGGGRGGGSRWQQRVGAAPGDSLSAGMGSSFTYQDSSFTTRGPRGLHTGRTGSSSGSRQPQQHALGGDCGGQPSPWQGPSADKRAAAAAVAAATAARMPRPTSCPNPSESRQMVSADQESAHPEENVVHGDS